MKESTFQMQYKLGDERNGQAGFSLIELLISITLFATVTGAVYGIMSIASKDRFTTNQRVQIMQSARNALNAIGRDAMNAGYNLPNTISARMPDNALNTVVGLPADTGTAVDLVAPIVAGPRITSNNLSILTSSPNGLKTDQVSFLYQDPTFYSGRAVPVTSVTAASNLITIDTKGLDATAATADDIDNTIFTTNDIYLAWNNTAAALGTVTALTGTNQLTFAATDPLSLNTPTGGGQLISLSAPFSITRVTWVTFRVLQDGTLVRTVYGGASPGKTDMPLAYGIEEMKVDYVTKDGTTYSSTTPDSPGAGTDKALGNADDTPSKLLDIRQIRVTLKVRSAENDLRNNNPFTTTLSATFNTRNLGYDKR
jgi:prepilin-type N-terminal cleavage/methylation domain-containing protein